MSGRPFEPVADRARWEIVYDHLAGLDIGDIVTYDELFDALDVRRREQVRTPVRKAAEKWGRERHRALVPVPTVGYKVASIGEHELLVRGQHRRSKRALSRGRTYAEIADRSLMTPQDRERFDGMERTIARQEDMIRRLDIKQQRTDRAIAESRQQQVATAERLQAVEDALRRHGIDGTPEGT